MRAIVSSGYSQDPMMSRYREYGFCGVVSKPYSVSELTQEIEQAISRVAGATSKSAARLDVRRNSGAGLDQFEERRGQRRQLALPERGDDQRREPGSGSDLSSGCRRRLPGTVHRKPEPEALGDVGFDEVHGTGLDGHRPLMAPAAQFVVELAREGLVVGVGDERMADRVGGQSSRADFTGESCRTSSTSGSLSSVYALMPAAGRSASSVMARSISCRCRSASASA